MGEIKGSFEEPEFIEKVDETEKNVASKIFNPDRRVEIRETKGKEAGEDAYNPDKRVETKDKPETGKTEKDYNPDKRVGVPNNETNEAKALDDATRVKLRELGMSEDAANKCLLKDNGIIKMKTIREELVGSRYPGTDVPFKKVTFDLGGFKLEGVFPEFKSKFDCYLSPESYKATDAKQFSWCNKALAEAVKNDPKLAKKFTRDQLEKIKNEDLPGEFTWHHDYLTGHMQLVDANVHQRVKHTGGKATWGGGR